jgi:formylmethanofuran dehydrogenase subunit C
VFGDADDWAGAEMRGGRIHVRGAAGDRAGAAYPGSRKGMRGGALLIDGGAGDDLGAAQRRGLIAVGGPVGDFAGAALVAGSLFLFGPVGRCPAAGMRRGTLALFGGPPALLPTFRYDGRYRPTFVDVYLNQLRAWGFPVPDAAWRGDFRRYAGDVVSLGRGELLVSDPPDPPRSA